MSLVPADNTLLAVELLDNAGSAVIPVSICARQYDTIRYEMLGYFDVRSKADMSQLNLQHGADN